MIGMFILEMGLRKYSRTTTLYYTFRYIVMMREHSIPTKTKAIALILDLQVVKASQLTFLGTLGYLLQIQPASVMGIIKPLSIASYFQS